MAFEKWKQEDGAWGNEVVAAVTACGLLLLVACYYVFTNKLDVRLAEDLKLHSPVAETTGSATR